MENVQRLIAYHGTSSIFDEFKLPEYIDGMRYHSARGFLGIYFTASKRLAACFAKHKWHIKNSPYRNNARLITASFILRRPRLILPVEHLMLPNTPDAMLSLREFYHGSRGYDGVVIEKKTQSEYFRTGRDQFPYICEYIDYQFIVFDPSTIEILSIKPLKVPVASPDAPESI